MNFDKIQNRNGYAKRTRFLLRNQIHQTIKQFFKSHYR